jgi:TPP-dependent pyruvate/acetoin dehydrogenase alpha subunit
MAAVIDRTVNFMGSSPIVGGTISIAVGSGLAARMYNKKQVAVAFFGDGATDEGVFYESLNFAIINKLPVLFIVENNGFSTHLPDFLRQSNPNIAERVSGFKINACRVDGNDPEKVYNTALEMAEKARKGEGPSLLECLTYRWLSHVGYWKDLDVGFRKKKDVEAWMERCPIKKTKKTLISQGILSQLDIDNIEGSVKSEVEESVSFARNSKSPDPETIHFGLFS